MGCRLVVVAAKTVTPAARLRLLASLRCTTMMPTPTIVGRRVTGVTVKTEANPGTLPSEWLDQQTTNIDVPPAVRAQADSPPLGITAAEPSGETQSNRPPAARPAPPEPPAAP